MPLVALNNNVLFAMYSEKWLPPTWKCRFMERAPTLASRSSSTTVWIHKLQVKLLATLKGQETIELLNYNYTPPLLVFGNPWLLLKNLLGYKIIQSIINKSNTKNQGHILCWMNWSTFQKLCCIFFLKNSLTKSH